MRPWGVALTQGTKMGAAWGQRHPGRDANPAITPAPAEANSGGP